MIAAKRSAARSSAASQPIALRRRAARAAQLRLQQARLHRHRARRRQVQRAALAAQAAEVGRMVRVAAHAGDRAPSRLDDHAAADAAVGAGRPRLGRGSCERRATLVGARTGCAARVGVERRPGAVAPPRTAKRCAQPTSGARRSRRRGRWSSCAAGRRRCRRRRCPATAARPCAGSGRAARRPCRRRCGRRRRRPPRSRARGARRARGMSSTLADRFQSLIARASHRDRLELAHVDVRLVGSNHGSGSPSSANCSRSHSARAARGVVEDCALTWSRPTRPT